jgi:hypothetical protein
LGYGISYKIYRILTESRKVTTAQSPIHRILSLKTSNNSDVEITPHDTELENAEEQSRIPLQQDETLKTEQITPPLEAPDSFPNESTTKKKI